nr:MAG TPA: hypothetical protein [Caudoviricetes sp.]
MKDILKHNPAKLDNVETMADAMIESMRYVDASVDYPDISKAHADDGVPAEWFYKAYNGAIPTSELTAILQYTQQRMIYDEIGEVFLGIAFVEMKHYDRLGDFIQHIGGEVTKPTFTSTKVNVTKAGVAEAIQLNIQSENDTIEAYEELMARILRNNPLMTATAQIAIQLLNKIVADERHHVTVLTELAQRVAENESKG